MIRFRDAVTLAGAKLHSRRVLLTFTILTSCLLFGGLFGGTFLFNGVESSMKAFNEQSHNGRYLVKASPIVPNNIYPNNLDLSQKTIDELKSLQADYIAHQKQLSKELNVPFDESLIKAPLKPSPFMKSTLPADKQLMIDFDSPIYKIYADEILNSYVQSASNTRQHLTDTANKYGVKNVFATVSSQTNFTNTVYLPDGKEDMSYLLKTPEPTTSGLTTYGYVVNSVHNSDYHQIDDSLLQNWILKPNQKNAADNDAVPVVITTKEAVSLFGKTLKISNEPTQATEKIKWMQDVQNKINGETYASCYRNDAERSKISQAMKDISDIKTNANNKDFVIPKVIYTLPTESCAEMTISRDGRTQKEKQDELKSVELEKRLGTYSEPQSMLIKFKVVGVVDMSEYSFSTPRDIEGFANNLFANTLSGGALIPKNLYKKSEASSKYDDILFGQYSKGNDSTDIYTKYGLTESILAFNDLSSARQFIKNEGCSEQEPDCNKLFHLDPYGSNYLLLDDLQATAKKVLDFALPIAVAIAGVISILTMSRIIIDSRRETAVFRALGAKRIDIVSVYLVYGLSVAILTTLCSILLGLVISLLVESIYGNVFTLDARVAFGLFSSATKFSFLGIDTQLVILLSLSIIATNVVAVLLSLVRNVRRNPISDMRDDG